MKNLLKPKLKLVPGTRLISFLFIGFSVLIAAGILWAANMYYNIDTGEVVVEEIKRVTGVLRATGGLIVGGTASQNPSSGYVFEVVGETRLATTSIASGQQLRFYDPDESNYVGLRAPALSVNTNYLLPTSTAPTLQYYLTVDPTSGQMSWDVPAGAGDIQAVGDCPSGECFTETGTQGTSLWFYDPQGRGRLIIADLTATTTYTLPNLSGTITLTSGNLGTGGVLFANAGLIATSTNFYWDNTSRYLQIGSSGNAGQIRLYSSNPAGYYLGFAATSTMTQTTTYYWPADYGTNNYVLTTDGTGNLVWKSVSGAGGVDVFGTPSANQVAFFYDENTIRGDSGMTYNPTTQKLTLSGGLITTLIQSLSGDITLDPASGIVQLASGDYIKTSAGYEIGKSGKQILREMIPILGFDLPVQTATTSYVKISKTLENYPFVPAATGTDRVHKLIFRYAASTTAPIDWRVATTTGQTYFSSTLPIPDSNNLEQGYAYVATTTIPEDGTDWWLDIKTTNVSDVVRVFQIFLAAYDQIQ